jgi:hypothetical protein
MIVFHDGVNGAGFDTPHPAEGVFRGVRAEPADRGLDVGSSSASRRRRQVVEAHSGVPRRLDNGSLQGG